MLPIILIIKEPFIILSIYYGSSSNMTINFGTDYQSNQGDHGDKVRFNITNNGDEYPLGVCL